MLDFLVMIMNIKYLLRRNFKITLKVIITSLGNFSCTYSLLFKKLFLIILEKDNTYCVINTKY